MKQLVFFIIYFYFCPSSIRFHHSICWTLSNLATKLQGSPRPLPLRAIQSSIMESSPFQSLIPVLHCSSKQKSQGLVWSRPPLRKEIRPLQELIARKEFVPGDQYCISILHSRSTRGKRRAKNRKRIKSSNQGLVREPQAHPRTHIPPP